MNTVESFFCHHLHNKTARIKSGELIVEGGIEEPVLLEYKRYVGLIVSTTLQYNYLTPIKEITNSIISNRENLNLSYETRDLLLDKLKAELSNTKICIAKILPYGVTNLETNFEKDKLVSLELTYENGSKISLYAISD